jgi:DNA-binding GntR family transcriptional regulator
MMLADPKKVATVIVSKMHNESAEMPHEGEVDYTLAKEDCCKKMIEAIKSGDVKALASAMDAHHELKDAELDEEEMETEND